MQIYGWGRYPQCEAETIYTPLTAVALSKQLLESPRFVGIARGMGRSYGDSALASQVISTRYLNHLLAFDKQSGLLHCAAGVTLADLLNVIIPHGWFLPVTPGTKFITIGGAIASDVHGKNHHGDGSFSDYISCFSLMLANGEIITCSRTEHSDLFHATCGGMGLTGIIVAAELQLKSIKSTFIQQTTYKASDLKHALELMREHEKATYSVAWIDCLARGKHLGRSLLMLGEHTHNENLRVSPAKELPIPIHMPSFVLNHYAIRFFNTLYYERVPKINSESTLYYDTYFYPLDKLLNWNRLYGKTGFVQYQFVLPKETGVNGLKIILEKMSASQRGSFLAVLKAFGKGNANFLSFPMEGYTLALDFKISPGLFELLDELDHIVLDYGGRLYLTKDARMSEKVFKQSYPRWEEFQKIRQRYGALEMFRSKQSERLGLNDKNRQSA